MYITEPDKFKEAVSHVSTTLPTPSQDLQAKLCILCPIHLTLYMLQWRHMLTQWALLRTSVFNHAIKVKFWLAFVILFVNHWFTRLRHCTDLDEYWIGFKNTPAHSQFFLPRLTPDGVMILIWLRSIPTDTYTDWRQRQADTDGRPALFYHHSLLWLSSIHAQYIMWGRNAQGQGGKQDIALGDSDSI